MDKFVKVLDGRKRPVRGLWRRNDRSYAQLRIADPATGKQRPQRIPLTDEASVPAATVWQAVAIMESLKHKRRETGLEAQRRRCPRFADYVDT